MSGSACIRLISLGPSRTLRDLGMSEEDIAARHFVNPAIVKQRLRLASVPPKLHEVYAEDGMTLEQPAAFSVTPISQPARSKSGRMSAAPVMTSHTRSAGCSRRTPCGSDPRPNL